MPVLIKDFSWSQTRGLVSIIIPLKAGVPRSDVDLFLAREYFKLSHPVSHVLELFLLHAVEPSIQKVEFVDGGKSVCVDLKKLEVGKEWTHLEKCLR